MGRLNDIREWMKIRGVDPTIYCSVVAHFHGKLHMKKVNEGTISWILSGLQATTRKFYYYKKDIKPQLIEPERYMYEWTMTEQQFIVDRVLEEYENCR